MRPLRAASGARNATVCPLRRGCTAAFVVVGATLSLSCGDAGPGTATPSIDVGAADGAAAPDSTMDLGGLPDSPDGADSEDGDDDPRVDANDGADSQDGGPDTAEPGGPGDLCEVDEDCQSLLCIAYGTGEDERICTTRCADDADCPDGSACVFDRGTGDDGIRLCIPTTLCVDRDGDGYGRGPGCSVVDCDDSNPAINPGADEVCDGFDNDCDERTDENPLGAGLSCDTGFAGVCAAGRNACVTGALLCDPVEAPSDERCNALDDDCDGQVDEDAIGATRWYRDADSDGWGANGEGVLTCSAPAPTGWVTRTGDCDDGAPTVFPGAPERCDRLDNDCNEVVDDDVVFQQFYPDGDRDGFGDALHAGVQACAPPTGFVANRLDCNDGDDTVRPDVVEIPGDGVDQNCDGRELCFLDGDGDGYVRIGDITVLSENLACDGPTEADRLAPRDDCNDSDEDIYPDALEVCDLVDNNCDGIVDADAIDRVRAWLDADQDGYGRNDDGELFCFPPAGWARRTGDCDDTQRADNPEGTEVCDGRDNDCDGAADGPNAVDAPPWYRDRDEDGFGLSTAVARACVQPAGFVAVDGDCDDRDPDIRPDAAERCDSVDNDCDGRTDEADAVDAPTWYFDGDTDSFGQTAVSVQACVRPAQHVADGGDCNDSDPRVYPGALEVCDGVDNDCDGGVDTGAIDILTWYRDADRDGFGDPAVWRTSCAPLEGYVRNAQDCDDGNDNANPDEPEVCDGVDNDCDRDVDEAGAADAVLWYLDGDGDGFGVALAPVLACGPVAGRSRTAGDCNDLRADVYPGAPEVCDGVDNNCIGGIDEVGADGAPQWFRDLDVDGYGNINIPLRACVRPVGYVADSTDCNDNDNTVYPGAPERCDGKDNNCDGTRDSPTPIDAPAWYADVDGDGYGDPDDVVLSCGVLAGRIQRGGDCNDLRDDINPAATEVCDGVDNNCDSSIDGPGAVGAALRYQDFDGDTYGNPGVSRVQCGEQPGWVNDARDCNDRNALVYPGRAELCNGIDDDCDLGVDESSAIDAPLWGIDRDGDGFGSGQTGDTRRQCPQPGAEWVPNASDCNDGDDTVFPGAPERCDGVDNNCSAGTTDEVCPLGCSSFVLETRSYMFCASTASWDAAATACANQDMRLTRVSSEAENIALRGRAATLGLQRFWLGGRRAAGTSLFSWADGTPFWNNGPVRGLYTNWAAGEPSLLEAGVQQECVELQDWGAAASGAWGDRACSTPQHFVCERY